MNRQTSSHPLARWAEVESPRRAEVVNSAISQFRAKYMSHLEVRESAVEKNVEKVAQRTNEIRASPSPAPSYITIPYHDRKTKKTHVESMKRNDTSSYLVVPYHDQKTKKTDDESKKRKNVKDGFSERDLQEDRDLEKKDNRKRFRAPGPAVAIASPGKKKRRKTANWSKDPKMKAILMKAVDEMIRTNTTLPVSRKYGVPLRTLRRYAKAERKKRGIVTAYDMMNMRSSKRKAPVKKKKLKKTMPSLERKPVAPSRQYGSGIGPVPDTYGQPTE